MKKALFLMTMSAAFTAWSIWFLMNHDTSNMVAGAMAGGFLQLGLVAATSSFLLGTLTLLIPWWRQR